MSWVHLCLCSRPPANDSSERQDNPRPDPLFLFPSSNNPSVRLPFAWCPIFFPFLAAGSRFLPNRSGVLQTGSWLMPVMEVLLDVIRQVPGPWRGGSITSDLGVACCLEAVLGWWGVRLAWGSDLCVIPLLFEIFSSSHLSCMVAWPGPIIPVASGWNEVALDFQSLMGNQMIGGLNFDGCCHVSELQDLCFSVHVVLSILKFAFRGFMCVS